MTASPTEKRSGLLTPDHSDIALVNDGRREVWTRKARPEYFCPRCGRMHRVWSKVGEAHDPRKAR